MNHIDDKRLWGALAGAAILVLLWMWLSTATLPTTTTDNLGDAISATQAVAVTK